MIEIEELWALIDRNVTLQVACADARGLQALAPFLSQDLRAPIDLPGFDQTSMDGYAFADFETSWHPIHMTIAAGDVAREPLLPGTAARVLTGAPIPSGTLLVARQEDCDIADGKVRLRPGCEARHRDYIRRRGAIFSKGDIVLHRGHRLHAGSLALLAALGIADVPQCPKLAALHIATGDELMPPGQLLPPGKIYDSNGPMIGALIDECHMTCDRLRLADDAGILQQTVGNFDGHLLLISGGSGPGDRDHTRHALESQGYTIHASSINSRPGKPLIFATRGGQVAFGLPGNPLSHWVCFHAFVVRAICRLHGQEPPRLMPVTLENSVHDSGDGRRTWTPVRLFWAGDRLMARPLSWMHSGDLRPLAEANGLLLDEQRTILTAPIL